MAEIWAKSKTKEGKIITLERHIKDLLCNLCSLYNVICDKLGNDRLFRLLKFVIFFHDLGKVSPRFQEEVENENFTGDLKSKGLSQDFLQRFPNIRHNILSLFFINKDKVKEICNNDEVLYSIFLSSIAFHHWRKDEKEYLLHLNEDLINVCKILCENENGKKLAEILKKHFKDFSLDGEKAEDLISFDKDLAEHIKEDGNLQSAGIISPYTLYFLPERLKMEAEFKIDLKLWIFLSGFLMRIDHFGSFCEKEDLNFEVEKEIPEINLKEKLKEKFVKNFWQKEFLDLKNENIVLIAPTGIGKTEFAFLWAEGEKFFYTLPLRVATNQMFERACEYFNEDKKEDEDLFIKGNVGLLHSDADLYIIDKWETSKNTDWDGETPKIVEISRHFSLPINVSTGDQIFPSALKYPGYERIYATVGYSKLIIDEVQAYDPRACAIVVKMIEDIVFLGGRFLLMTATLPEFVRKELENRKLKWVEIDLYKGKIKDITRHKIELRNEDIEDDINRIIEKAKEGKRVLVVLNTVQKAEEVHKKIKEKNFEGFLELLHSRFTLNERKKKEEELEKEFKNPKPQNEKSPKILVATQVVEASLDIDADYLFTEIAPIDSLIQRMGRVVRRVDLITGKIKGSEKDFKYDDFYNKDEANVYIYFKHKEKDKEYLESGKGHVYEKDILVLTLGKLCGCDDLLEKLKEVGTEKEYDKKMEKILEESKKKVKNGKNTLGLKESEKNEYVRKVYCSLNEKFSSYLQKFYETLNILDVGYVSENKDEAHKVFREIYTIPVITSDKIDKIVEKINQATNINWLWFKREIIAEFVINENMWRYKEYKLESLWEKIEKIIEDKIKDEEIKKKLKEIEKKLEKYCSGIYVVKDEENLI